MLRTAGFMIFLLSAVSVFAQDNANISLGSTPNASTTGSLRTVKIYFENSRKKKNKVILKGNSTTKTIEFTIRKDEIVTKAQVHLSYIPSPSLQPIISQLKYYINEELLGVIPITANQLGKLNHFELTLDPRYIADYNRLTFEFVDQPIIKCQDVNSDTLWLEVSQSSALELVVQSLPINNDLSSFPRPFFDYLDYGLLKLPMVFAEQPNITQLQAAGLLASFFGSKSLWRGQSFPTYYNQIPKSNFVVFATNSSRPDFLKNYRTVDAPTIEIINNPNNPMKKVLLILGRDDKDLNLAVQAIAQGNILFRGTSVRVNKIESLEKRKPYDAPNWVPTNRPVQFSELEQFKGQLRSKGTIPYPIVLYFNLPPDLFSSKATGVPVHMKYRYSIPPALGFSYVTVNLNDYFVTDYRLSAEGQKKEPHLETKSISKGGSETFTIPNEALQPSNQLQFSFNYVTEYCGNLAINSADIDSTSTIDFSNYYHYMKLPDLSAYINSGFPFSRFADLSESMVLIDKDPEPKEVTTLLNALGNIGSQTGYPATAYTLTNDPSLIKNKDKDVLIIGRIPAKFLDEHKLNLLIERTQSWVREPMRKNELGGPPENSNTIPATLTSVSSSNPVAGMIQVQSPYHSQRSIIALLAEGPSGFDLLNNALTDQEKQTKINGSVSIFRNSGVNSLLVGDIYHIGYIPLWTQFWLVIQKYPISLSIAALLVAVIFTFILWRVIKEVRRRRLKVNN
ncbi:Cellulose synthase regulatory subunit [Legionella wadsworthii]|uniref:Cyclic di-GMP-binding protein n=1 Tax=Legionella wadsworthii TaxID=28088 RepID=A0A378LP36_9GAMM|nr:cellulose biosynthesis cyclic di-GMP-binding regulatory protein BcsB [Legionella wadsworthii]STY28745.1 Cellulose synthase regulatory subunit [Legionella wadsworthii]